MRDGRGYGQVVEGDFASPYNPFFRKLILHDVWLSHGTGEVILASAFGNSFQEILKTISD